MNLTVYEVIAEQKSDRIILFMIRTPETEIIHLPIAQTKKMTQPLDKICRGLYSILLNSKKV